MVEGLGGYDYSYPVDNVDNADPEHMLLILKGDLAGKIDDNYYYWHGQVTGPKVVDFILDFFEHLRK